LDLSDTPNGSTIYFVCTANNRPNNITVKTGSGTVDTTGWFGNSNGYDSEDYWYPTTSNDPITLTITYDNTKTYYINTLTAPMLAYPNGLDDLWSVDIQCAGVVTPTPTPSPTPPLNRFYVASPVMDIDTTYCVTPGYVLTGALWSYATTISGLMNQQVYLDQNGNNVFIGVEGYKYAVSLTSGINTFTNGSSYYELIQIYENGTVWNVLSPNCGSSGGGGDVPQ
jgi:hypothetical protein